MTNVNIENTEHLQNLKRTLAKFAVSVNEANENVQMDIRQTRNYLDERKQYWHNQVRQLKSEVRQRQQSLNNCQHPARTTKTKRIDCFRERRALAKAQQALGQAQLSLKRAEVMIKEVDIAVGKYETKARKLKRLADDSTQAQSFLSQKYNDLKEYASKIFEKRGEIGCISSSFPGSPPDPSIQIAADAINKSDKGRNGLFGVGSEAASKNTMGDQAVDLNKFKTNCPTYDILSKTEIASVKTHFGKSFAKAYQKDFYHMMGWDRPYEGGRSPLEQDAKRLLDIANDSLSLPKGFGATDKMGAEYLKENSVLRIPDDHVQAVQDMLIEDMQRLPESYGHTNISKEQAEKIVEQRVKGIGIKSTELKKLVDAKMNTKGL